MKNMLFIISFFLMATIIYSQNEDYYEGINDIVIIDSSETGQESTTYT